MKPDAAARGKGGDATAREPAAVSTGPAGDARPPGPAADPWGWVTLLAVLPLAHRMLGAAWAEPVAEDFDFLHRALIQGTGSLLDGGGSQAFWRPIPHQLYYAVFGRLLLAAPPVVAVVHLGLLALAAWLLFRALQPAFGGPLACAAASFTLLSESTRTIASWATQFVDLGLFLFSALALHAASRGRTLRALLSLLAALLCKEVAVVTALLLPFFPGVERGRLAKYGRWKLAGGSLAVLALWGFATVTVRRAAHLELPQRIAGSSEALTASWPERFAWALGGSIRALGSLPLVPGPQDRFVIAGALALALAAGIVFGASRAARERLRKRAAMCAWGATWFVLATAALMPIYPSWQPNRSQFGGAGFGVAAVGTLAAAHPVLAGLVVAGRLAALELAPGPARVVTDLPAGTGAFMDYERLTRLQRFMRSARLALGSRQPPLPRGAIVVQHDLSHGVEYAFGGDHAIQVWTRDPTAHWMRFETFAAHPDTAATVLLEGTLGHEPPAALVEVGAMRALFRAQALARSARWPELLRELDLADSLQRDPHAVAFRVTSGSWRATAELSLGRAGIAEAIVRPLVALDPADPLSRQVLALALATRGRFADAAAELDSLERLRPHDASTPGVRAQVEQLRAQAASGGALVSPSASPPAR